MNSQNISAKESEESKMEKITSFTIDHIKLQPGIYVSRKDPVGDSMITTFDIRMTSPNEEPVMNTAELHAMEHLAATFLRNHKEFGPKVIYWGPMGCRTGNCLRLRSVSRMERTGLLCLLPGSRSCNLTAIRFGYSGILCPKHDGKRSV